MQLAAATFSKLSKILPNWCKLYVHKLQGGGTCPIDGVGDANDIVDMQVNADFSHLTLCSAEAIRYCHIEWY